VVGRNLLIFCVMKVKMEKEDGKSCYCPGLASKTGADGF
jgi:hypothetical protein